MWNLKFGPLAITGLIVGWVGTASAQAPSVVGCADGAREGFLGVSAYPNIAGCGGAWTIPGIANFAPAYAPSCPSLPVNDTRTPACGRTAGDDSANPAGTNCNGEDLCAAGWHICLDVKDVKAATPTPDNGCAGAVPPGSTALSDPLWFATRQATTGYGRCADGAAVGGSCNSYSGAFGCLNTESTTNDVYGCGNIGAGGSCSGLSMTWTGDLCNALSAYGWSCNLPGAADDSGLCETYTLVHSNPNTGGVLCCRDATAPDTDGDGVPDTTDNCVGVPNADQLDLDVDGFGDVCDTFVCIDNDGDGACNQGDNCLTVANPDQLDTDDDGIGDACECLGVTCAPPDACHTAGTCQPTTGTCSSQVLPCAPSNACFTASCHPTFGCVQTPKTCSPQDACHTASCNPSVGCVQTPITCPSGNACVSATCNPFFGCGYSPVTCGANATCDTGSGCECDSGYEGDGQTCTDIDDCAGSPCLNGGLCVDGLNSYQCICPGYLVGTHCDACAPGTFNYPTCTPCSAATTCSGNGVCTSSGACACNVGFTGPSCTDIDECAANTDGCDVNATCTNTPGTYTCACNPGYQGPGSGPSIIGAPPGLGTLRHLVTFENGVNGWFSKHCGTVDCPTDPVQIVTDSTAPSPTHVQRITRIDSAGNYFSPFVPLPGGATYCFAGWIRWQSGGWPFIGIDKFNAAGGHLGENWLIGKAGFTDSAGGTVTPVPSTGTGWAWYSKTLTVPTATAKVRLKTELWDGASKGGPHLGWFDDIAIFDGACPTQAPVFVQPPCADIDECATNTDNCSANATCTNTVGSFTCTCIAGYTGDGVTCTDIDECAANTDNCGENAVCTNLPGTFSCACATGYFGNGLSCCPDTDGDTVCTPVDNCPTVANTAQTNSDTDGAGDACDACPNDAENDADQDGICGDVDTCPYLPNAAPSTAAPSVFWADWHSTVVEAGVLKYVGTITVVRPNGQVVPITVKYSGPRGIAFFQTGSGTDYFTSGGVRNPATSPFTSATVPTIPPAAELIGLRYAQKNTLEFSAPVGNPLFSYVSLNGNGYGFDQDFEILSFGHSSNGNTCGYWGCGTSYKTVAVVAGQTEYQLLGTGEPHGTLRFTGAFDEVNWRSLSDEYWNGFTVGITGLVQDVVTDTDGDCIPDNDDNCPTTANPGQEDGDGDGFGDVCDNCPIAANPGQEDTDGDGDANACDNCPNAPNADQADADGDGTGDVCDDCPFLGGLLANGASACADDGTKATCLNGVLTTTSCGTDTCSDTGSASGGGACAARDFFCSAGVCGSTATSGIDACGGSSDQPSVTTFACNSAGNRCDQATRTESDACADSGDGLGGGTCSATNWTCTAGVLSGTTSAGADLCVGDDAVTVTHFACSAGDGTAGDTCTESQTTVTDACSDVGSDHGAGTCSATDWRCVDGNRATSMQSSHDDVCFGDDDSPGVLYGACASTDGAAADTCVTAQTTEFDSCSQDGDSFGGGACAATDWQCADGTLAATGSTGTDVCSGDDQLSVASYDCAAANGGVADVCTASTRTFDDQCADSGSDFGGGACSASNWACNGSTATLTESSGTDVCSGDDEPSVTAWACGASDGSGADTCSSAVTTRSDTCADTGTPSGGGTCSATNWVCDGTTLTSTSNDGRDTCGDGSSAQVDYFVCESTDGASGDTCVAVADTTPPTLTCPARVVSDCTRFQGVRVDGVLADTGDICDDSVDVANDYNDGGIDASGDFAIGETVVVFTATDDAGNAATCVTIVEVQWTPWSFAVYAASASGVQMHEESVVTGDVFSGTHLQVHKKALVEGASFSVGKTHVHKYGSVEEGVYASTAQIQGTGTHMGLVPANAPFPPILDSTAYDAAILAANGVASGNLSVSSLALAGTTRYVNGNFTLAGGTLSGPGTVVATGNITINDNSVVGAGVTLIAGDGVHLRKKVSMGAGGLVYGRKHVHVHDEAVLSGTSLLSPKHVHLGKLVQVTGLIFGAEHVQVGASSTVNGSVLSRGPVQLHKDATVAHDCGAASGPLPVGVLPGTGPLPTCSHDGDDDDDGPCIKGDRDDDDDDDDDGKDGCKDDSYSPPAPPAPPKKGGKDK